MLFTDSRPAVVPRFFIKNLSFSSNRESESERIFGPSRLNNVLGYLPYVGNFILFGSARHAYSYEEIEYGHRKFLEGVLGVFVDHYCNGITTGSLLVDIAQIVVIRANAFAFLNHFILNPPIYEYKHKGDTSSYIKVYNSGIDQHTNFSV